MIVVLSFKNISFTNPIISFGLLLRVSSTDCKIDITAIPTKPNMNAIPFSILELTLKWSEMIGVNNTEHEIPATNDTIITNTLSLRLDAVTIKDPMIADDIIPIDSLIVSN